MRTPHKQLKAIALFLALNIFGVYVGALFNFHMHHIFHKALLPQDMVCSSNKQKFLYAVTSNDYGNGSQLPNSDGIIECNPSLQLDHFIPSIRLSLQQQEKQHFTSYTGYCQSLRAPPSI